jgi:hypothetical protein
MNVPLSGFYVSDSAPVASQVCQNLYVNYPEVGAMSQAQLFSTQGIKLITSTGGEEVNRGGGVMNGVPFFVNGNNLYRLNRSFNALGNALYEAESLGLIEGKGQVSTASNGTQLCIVVPNTNIAYIYSESTGLVRITDPNFIPQPISSVVNFVVFIDGFFVFAADNSVFFHSRLNNGLSYIATDFGRYDDAQGDTTKAYRNVGGTGFVFSEIQGFVLPKGCASRFSIIELDSSFAMIGQGENESPRIYIFSGNGYSQISSLAIDTVLNNYNDVDFDDAFSFNYSFKGAIFGGWSLNNNTFVYDAYASRVGQTKAWHERRSSNLQDKSRWRVNALLQAYGETFVADSEGGNIGVLDDETFTEYGNIIVRQFALPTIENDGNTVFHGSIELVLDNGYEQGLLSMQYSNNGITYKQERTRAIGDQGQYGKRVIFRRLGATSKLRIYRFTMTSPIKWTVLKCILVVE